MYFDGRKMEKPRGKGKTNMCMSTHNHRGAEIYTSVKWFVYRLPSGELSLAISPSLTHIRLTNSRVVSRNEEGGETTILLNDIAICTQSLIAPREF